MFCWVEADPSRHHVVRREVAFILRDATPKVLFADGMSSAAVLGALTALGGSGPPQPLIVWVSRTAPTLHDVICRFVPRGMRGTAKSLQRSYRKPYCDGNCRGSHCIRVLRGLRHKRHAV